MAPETCEYHTQLATDMAVIKNDVQYIKERVCTHIYEGEKQGGFRDRLSAVESDISALKKAMWIRVIVAGVIGGMIANGSDEAFRLFVKFLTGA